MSNATRLIRLQQAIVKPVKAPSITEENLTLAVIRFLSSNDAPITRHSTVIILILNYCKYFNYPIYEREYRKETTGSHAHDCLRLIHYVMKAYHRESTTDWGYVLAAIIKVASWRGEDVLNILETVNNIQDDSARKNS
jgi:hypothetical protein